jgi:hypothetical protein
MSAFDTEKKAMVGDQGSVLRVVSTLRSYREEVRQLLADRFRDGAVDGQRLRQFETRIMELEEDLGKDT